MNTGLFAVGDCPVCADSGVVVVLRARGTATFVFYCPLCGTAWKAKPLPRELEEVLSLSEVAPGGVDMPDRDEVKGAASNVQELTDPFWSSLVNKALADEGAGS